MLIRKLKVVKCTIRDKYFQILYFLRVQRPITLILGPLNKRSSKLIEIDITYNCNLKCVNCDRSSGLAPSKEQMTVEQVRKFTDESIKNNIKWDRIRVLGGEPTLHSDLLEILKLLLDYKYKYSSDTQIQLVSNGFGELVNRILSELPKDIDIENTSKSSNVQQFHPFNIAPRDLLLWKKSDFSNGCWVIAKCGFGLTRYGYYPCSVAGSIDRILGFDCGRKELPSDDDEMVDELKLFCKYCGHFRKIARTDKEVISQTWIDAYEEYNRTKPGLSLY